MAKLSLINHKKGQYKIAGKTITLTHIQRGHAIDLKATPAARPSLLPFLTTQSAIPSIPHPTMLPHPTIPVPHP
jgi:hypothetical protein